MKLEVKDAEAAKEALRKLGEAGALPASVRGLLVLVRDAGGGFVAGFIAGWLFF